MGCPSSLDPNQLVILTSLVSVIISDDLNADDLNVLGAFITSVGDLLSLKAARLSIIETKQNTIQQIQDLEDQIKKLKDSLK